MTAGISSANMRAASSRRILVALVVSHLGAAYGAQKPAFLRYNGVSCDTGTGTNNVLSSSGRPVTLDSCTSGCAANGFGVFANWDGDPFRANATGHCTVFNRCDAPKCDTRNSTWRNLARGGTHDWVIGCAADPPTPAPAPRPGPRPGPGVVVPCFDASCRHWLDTDGNRIEAHAAGMLEAPNGRWYWYGESKKTPQLQDHGVNCYSAPSISGPWKNEGAVLNQSDIVLPGDEGPYIVERPKVLYNENTKTYVMWFHLDKAGYSFKHAGIATSTQPHGPFKFSKGLLPDNLPSYDMSLWRDPQDGQAYFVRSVDNKFTAISRLAPDYMSSTGIISNHSVFEGMALFRHPNGTYYIVGSHLTGWAPNELMLFRANGKTLDDPQWVDMGNPTGDPTSFNSQPTYVVQYTPQDGDPYFVYMGDNWLHGSNETASEKALVDAAYVWIPFWFKDNGIELHRQEAWDLEEPYPTCPTAGTQLFLSACGRDGQNWGVQTSAGRVTLAGSNQTMCATYSDGAQVVLGECRDAVPFEWTGSRMKAATESNVSLCMSVPLCPYHAQELNVCAGEYVAMEDCAAGGHGNQDFVRVRTHSGATLLQSAMDSSKCLTACM